MPAPAIQVATTPDGGRVTYHVMGTGPAVAMLFPYHVNHLTLNWDVPLHRGAMQFLARHFNVINLDFPGAGLSSPLEATLSLDAFSSALEAVLDAAGVAHIGICALGAAGLIACHFAARNPQRVAAVVFVGSGESDANRQLLHIRRDTPRVEAELRGALLGGIGDKRNAGALARVAEAALEPAALAQWEDLLRRERLLDRARAVSAPSLYVHAADDQLVPRAAAEEFVAHLQHATLQIVPGRSGMDTWRHRGVLLDIVRFLDNTLVRRPVPARRPLRRAAAHPAGLSAREVDVIRLLTLGRTNQQIADELFISLNTVSFHLRNIFAKTRASNRTEAAAFALQAGLVPRP